MKQSKLNNHFATSKKKKTDDPQFKCFKAKQAKDKLQLRERDEGLREEKNDTIQQISLQVAKGSKTDEGGRRKRDIKNGHYDEEREQEGIVKKFYDMEKKLEAQDFNGGRDANDTLKNEDICEVKDTVDWMKKKRVKVSEESEHSESNFVELNKENIWNEAKRTDNVQKSWISENFSVDKQSSNCINKDVKLEEKNCNENKNLKFREKGTKRGVGVLSNSTLQIIQNIRSLKEKKESEQIYEKKEFISNSSWDSQPIFTNEDKIDKSIKNSIGKISNKARFQSPIKQRPQTENSNISQETLNIINSIKAKNGLIKDDNWISDQPKTEAEHKVNGILSSLSMREKYSELLTDDDNKLILPTHFKILLKFMRVLDDALIFAKSRCKTNFIKFDDVAISVESITHRTFTMNHFAQILTADPNFYIYEWNKAIGSKEYSLFINIPEKDRENIEWVNNRAKKLKNILLKITEGYHSEFLNKLKNKNPELKEHLEAFDPVYQKWWYHEFDPNNIQWVPQLALFNIGERPCTKRSESVSDFCKRNRSSQKGESLSKLSHLQRNILKAAPNALFTPISKPVEEKPKADTINGIPADLFKRIQEKDNANKEERKKAENERNGNKNIILKETLIKLIESIKSIYSVKRTNSLFINLLSEELKDTQRGCFDGIHEFKEHINHLHKASPKWMKIVFIGNNQIVKIDPNYRKTSVKHDIEKYITENINNFN